MAMSFSFNNANTISETILNSALGGVNLNPLYSSPLTSILTGNQSLFASMSPLLPSMGSFGGSSTVLGSLGFLGPDLAFDASSLHLPSAQNAGNLSLTPKMMSFLQLYSMNPESPTQGLEASSTITDALAAEQSASLLKPELPATSPLATLFTNFQSALNNLMLGLLQSRQNSTGLFPG